MKCLFNCDNKYGNKNSNYINTISFDLYFGWDFLILINIVQYDMYVYLIVITNMVKIVLFSG